MEIDLSTSSSDVTPVIFRVWNDATPGTLFNVFALFPANPSDYAGHFCDCYEHVGQHGGADYQHCIAASRPATPAEYADLRRELESYPYGYRLKVYQHRTPQHRAAYDAELKALHERLQREKAYHEGLEDGIAVRTPMHDSGDYYEGWKAGYLRSDTHQSRAALGLE